MSSSKIDSVYMYLINKMHAEFYVWPSLWLISEVEHSIFILNF